MRRLKVNFKEERQTGDKVSIKIYRFEDCSAEVIQDPANNLSKSLQDELLWECTEVSRDSFGNSYIKEEFVRSCVLYSSLAVFGRDETNRLIGYTTNSIINFENYYIIYLNATAILKKFQKKGIRSILSSVKMIEEKNKIKELDIDLSCIILASRTQNPVSFKLLNRGLGLFPNPDGTIDEAIRNIGKKFVSSLYAKSHIDYGKQIEFDDQTFVERGAYKSVTQTSVNGVYPSGIPFCHDDDEINQYMNQHLNWQNGDALILMGYYDEEKINRMFEEVQQKMGFCGIEEAELDLYHAVPM